MALSPQECRGVLFKRVLLLILIAGIDAVLTSVSPGTPAINSITTYTWTITFNSGAPFTSLTLNFPTQVTILSNYTVTIGNAPQNSTPTSTSITITSPISAATVVIAVANIQNPSSAIFTNAFSYSNENEGPISLSYQIQYLSGSLASCPWSFSLCTEQSPGDLLVSFTTINRIPSGTSYFVIGFPSSWPNHAYKGLNTGTNPTCFYSTDGGLNYTQASGCASKAIKIQVQFTSPNIANGTSIIVKVRGINAPPTSQTAANTAYSIYTSDSAFNRIDQLTGCAISSVCITNETVGTFANTTMNVNANYGNPNITFLPVDITFQSSDTIEVSYSPFSSLISCTTLTITRSSNNQQYQMLSPTSSSTSITFTLPSDFGYNEQFNQPIIARLICTSFRLPPSETPVSLSFNFRRNSDSYLVLSSPITASATTFNSSKGKLSQNSTAMLAVSTFTFNFLTGQQLGTNPAIDFIFPVDFIIAAPTCTASVIGFTITQVSCPFSNSTNSVRVNLTANSVISASSNVTITISGVTNPNTPKAYSFAMSTYYSSTVTTSRVETSVSAFSTTITEITNFPVTLSPAGLTVYSPISITLSFTPTVTIPIFSTFYVEFPPNVSSLLPDSSILKIGGASQALSGNPTVSTTATSASVTFISGVQITLGSSVSIVIPLTTPNNIGTYSYVKLVVSNGGNIYLSNNNSLYLNVDKVSSMSVTVAPLSSIAGQPSSYTFTLLLTIPHSTTFIVQIDVPSDTKFIASGATCTNCTASSMSPVNSSTFSFTASNPNNYQSFSFTISSFTNPRSVSTSLPWGIATKTVSPTNLISYSYANASIKNPNTLTANLSKSDSYYRSNTNPVKMTLTFFNQLIATDYIQLTFTSESYTGSNVTCSPIYGICSMFGTPSNVTVVKIIPNTTSIINGTLQLILEGLTSSVSSGYSSSTTISVATFATAVNPIDAGLMTYNISCGAAPDNFCKQCYFDNSCINCYSGYYLQGSVCVNLCGQATKFMSYGNSTTGTCVTCINNCLTCSDSVVCRSCIPKYYFYVSDSTCRISCPTTAGYFSSNGSCSACVSNCLECVNGSNSCTRCDNATFLIGGLCQNGCGSTNYYQLNGQCLSCDVSCYNCSGAGAGNCYMCSAIYHRYLALCVLQCPNGTAVNPSTGGCGCDPLCLTCSTFKSCTACYNTSMWVLNGGCIDSCPTSTYASSGQCLACSTGCLTCTINTCSACVNSSYLFNNSCYSDCNLISQQYDAFGSSCVLCPTGCDHCSGTNCTSCLDGYTLNSTQCVKACLLTNTCEINSQVIPLPGMLSLVVWVGISVVIHLLYHKNYLPYSIILLSGVIQFVLILALITSAKAPVSRLLATTDNAYLSQMQGLLGGAIAANYLENVCYLIIFICYIKPLITNPRQIDIISNVVVLVIACATNFRFGLIAFARMFPKPSIFVQDGSKLTPVHYLCLVSLCLDLLSVVACGLGLINSQKLSNTFMLSLDLIIVIALNMALTIWFVAAKKPDEYFQDAVKKYHIEDNAHTRTDETLPNEKNLSKTNMIGNESFNFDDFDRTENDDASYNKLTQNKNNANGQNFTDDPIKENPLPVTVLAKSNRRDNDPFADPNFETNLKSKRSTFKESSMIISKADFSKGIDSEGKSVEDNLSARKNHVISSNFSKDPAKSERKRVEPQKNIVEVEESDYPDRQENSEKGANLFNSKGRLAKPKKVKQARGKEEGRTKQKGEESRGKAKGVEEPMKLMKKGDKKIGYFQSDAYESNADGQDLQEIIKQKIWQSTIKLEKPSLSSGVESETAHEEISPSWFNVQNQRLDITDLDEADPE